MPDKPAHVLEISEALGRDVDKAKAGKLKDALPVEAFMSDAALEQVARQSRAEPVRADALTPFSRAEAAARTTFTRDGEAVPLVPSVRRVIPAPFQRPSINAGGHGKAWQYVAAPDVVPGDLVPDVGIVAVVKEKVVYATRDEVLDPDFTLPVITAGLDIVVSFETASALGHDIDTEKVAIGVIVIVTGQGGNVRAFREDDQVAVFRKTSHD